MRTLESLDHERMNKIAVHRHVQAAREIKTSETTIFRQAREITLVNGSWRIFHIHQNSVKAFTNFELPELFRQLQKPRGLRRENFNETLLCKQTFVESVNQHTKSCFHSDCTECARIE